eukprot:5010652-Pleurochrysis_carterae.AAC.1
MSSQVLVWCQKLAGSAFSQHCACQDSGRWESSLELIFPQHGYGVLAKNRFATVVEELTQSGRWQIFTGQRVPSRSLLARRHDIPTHWSKFGCKALFELHINSNTNITAIDPTPPRKTKQSYSKHRRTMNSRNDAPVPEELGVAALMDNKQMQKRK